MLSDAISGSSRIRNETEMILNDILIKESIRVEFIDFSTEQWELAFMLLNSEIADEGTLGNE